MVTSEEVRGTALQIDGVPPLPVPRVPGIDSARSVPPAGTGTRPAGLRHGAGR